MYFLSKTISDISDLPPKKKKVLLNNSHAGAYASSTGQDEEEAEEHRTVVMGEDIVTGGGDGGASIQNESANASSPSIANRIFDGDNNNNNNNIMADDGNDGTPATTDGDVVSESAISAYIVTRQPQQRRRRKKEPDLVNAVNIEDDVKKWKWSTMLILVFVVILVVAVVAITTYFVRIRREEEYSDSNNDSFSLAPSSSIVVDENVYTTFDPSLSPTTMQPTEIITFKPTSMKVTEMIQVLKNEVPTFYESDVVTQIIRSILNSIGDSSNGTTSTPYPPQVSNLDDPSSPQYRAAQWIAEIDDYPLPLNFSDFMQGYDFVSRYALAVFYYSTVGEEWFDQCNFLNTSLHHCSWQCDASELLEQQSLWGLDETNYSEADFNLLHDAFNGVKCASEFGIEGYFESLVFGFEFIFNNLSGTIPPELGWGTLPFILSLSFNPNLRGSIPLETFPRWILSLSLHANNLEGSISSRIGDFVNASWLRLSQNNIGGPIPSEIGRLSNLQYMDLFRNDLTGTIPTQMMHMSSLKILDLTENMLTGPVPNLFSIEMLGTFRVEDNALTGSIPDMVVTNKNNDTAGTNYLLDDLWLGMNLLTGKIPHTIATRTNLKILHLWFNDLSGEIVADDSPLWELTDLLHLHMRSNRFSGTVSSNIGNLKWLRGILFSHNHLEGILPPTVGNLVESVYFSVGNNSLTGQIPSSIGLLTNLEVLGLYSNQFSGSIPDSILSMTALREFYVHHNDLTGSTLVDMCDETVVMFESFNIYFNYTADCDELECPCCVICCRDEGDDASSMICEPR